MLALLRRICVHGSEEQRDRLVGDGWLPILLDARPLDLLGRKLIHRLRQREAVFVQEDEECKAYGLHIAATLAAAMGRAAPGQGRFMALCQLLMRLAQANEGNEGDAHAEREAEGRRREDLRQALPWLLPALASYGPSCLRPSRRREAVSALRAVLMAGEEHWAVAELAGLEEARSR